VLGFVVGLAAEGRIAARLGPVAIGGGLPAGAATAAENLVARGVTGLVSFGLAGGLDPALRPGAIIIPARLRDGADIFNASPLLGPMHGDMVAGDRIVATAADKRALFLATGACALDLESGAVARVAARHHLPFAVLRAICDPAERYLPPAALVALDQAGAIGLWRVLVSLARAPQQLPGLLALARDAAAARRALLAATRAI